MTTIFKRAEGGRGLPRGRLSFRSAQSGRPFRSYVASALLMTAWGAAFSRPARAETRPDQDVHSISQADNDLLDDISRRSFRFFWEKMDPHTGLVLDRTMTDGGPDDNPNHNNVASIAATGFGLSALSIGAAHRWVSPVAARRRIVTSLRFFADKAPQKRGWFYHFMDWRTGERRWNCEVSSIDTALLLAGILTARQAFANDPEIARLATLIYNRVDFQWMLNGDRMLLSHGWKPETGFIPHRWDTYSEANILYTLAIGSPTHPIPPDAWYAWKLPVVNASGYQYIGGGPLFIQQYSQAWLDLRDRIYTPHPLLNRFVPQVNFFANSVAATRAQQALGVGLSQKFPGYSEKVWGITASDSSEGYVAWGAQPNDSRIDGTVVPSAAAGSVMFTPDICIPALRAMLLQYGRKIYGRYGFADAFNPTSGWVSRYVIGIDQGITLLSAEDSRTGSVWHWFMGNPEVDRALYYVGLVPESPPAPLQSRAETGKRDWPPEIPLTYDHQIPASAFKYKIPLPARQ